MKNSEIENDLEQFQELLNCPEQKLVAWCRDKLFRKNSLNVPPDLEDYGVDPRGCRGRKSYNKIKSELPPNLHIEHILSHLGDYSAIASRTLKKEIEICKENFTLDCIEKIHNKILKYIADTIQYDTAM